MTRLHALTLAAIVSLSFVAEEVLTANGRALNGLPVLPLNWTASGRRMAGLPFGTLNTTATGRMKAGLSVVVAEDNSQPFFVGSEKLAGLSSAAMTLANNSAVSSLLDVALSKKYDDATIAAWRRLVSGDATLTATSGPSLSGEIKCFVGSSGEVVGLQYGTSLLCQSSNIVVNVKIAHNYVSNVKVVLGKNAMIAGLQFIVTNGISGTSSSTWCGTKNGLSAYVGRAGMAVGALGGTCAKDGSRRRRLFQSSNSTSGIVGGTFTSVVAPAPQGENDSPPFGSSTSFIVDGHTVTGGEITGHRLHMRRRLLFEPVDA